ncbi:LPS assembly lipoprotein LptE [Candidatus Pelagibacter sp. HIMB1485]|uniref:LPS assembly lipoprotein LptE n=1 Tax=Candidatus Pelagibacter sp. HIMB1485 TaxID=3415415 RepID=UPI003F83747E
MMIYLKQLKIFLFLFLLISCGYTPVYENLNKIDFKLNISNLNGVRELNNKIKSNLNRYTFKASEKVFNISINSKYTKNIIAKDATGAATEFEIIIDVAFKVDSENYKNTFEYNESFTMKSKADKIEEQEYEENLTSNIIDIITQELISRLSLL